MQHCIQLNHVICWFHSVDFQVSGVPEGIDQITLSIGASTGEASGFGLGDPVVDVAADGTASGHIDPADAGPALPDADGYPMYSASAYYTVEVEGQEFPDFISSNPVAFTIVAAEVVPEAPVAPVAPTKPERVETAAL